MGQQRRHAIPLDGVGPGRTCGPGGVPAGTTCASGGWQRPSPQLANLHRNDKNGRSGRHCSVRRPPGRIPPECAHHPQRPEPPTAGEPGGTAPASQGRMPWGRGRQPVRRLPAYQALKRCSKGGSPQPVALQPPIGVCPQPVALRPGNVADVPIQVLRARSVSVPAGNREMPSDLY